MQVGGAPRTEKARLKRERLLESALQEFGRFGYAKATISRIARDAGLNKATLYYYFPGGKEELLKQTLVRYAESIFMRTQSRLARHTDPVERLRVYVEARVSEHIDTVRNQGLTQEILIELTPIAERALGEAIGREVGLITGLLQACQPDADGSTLLLRARVLMSTIKGVLFDLPGDTADADVARVREALQTLVVAGYG